MYVRIARAEAQAGKAAQFAAMWKQHVVSELREMPGFIRAYQTGDPESGNMVGIVFWESKPDEAEFQKHLPAMYSAMSSVAAGPPQFEDLEVLAES